MGAKLGGKGMVADINMTPLIDIVLVVLIIMMVNIPIQVEQMGVKLPAEVQPDVPPPPPSDQLVMALYEDGKIALNRTVYAEEDLFAQVTQRLKAMTNKIVFVDAHPSVPYGDVVDVVDIAKEAGAEKVGFAKLKDVGPASWIEVGEGGMPRGVYLGSPATAGSMNEKDAFEQFQPMKATIEGCYATALATNAKLTGRVLVQVDIGPQGEVMATELVNNTTGDAALGTCIADKLPSLKYEALGYPNTARAQYPIVFSPG